MRDFLEPYARVYLDSRCLQYGDAWDIELPKAQEHSLVTVIVISEQTERAFYAEEEIAAAIALSREDPDQHRVVPIILSNTPDAGMPYGLRRLHGPRLGDQLSLQAVAGLLVNQLAVRQGKRAATGTLHQTWLDDLENRRFEEGLNAMKRKRSNTIFSDSVKNTYSNIR